MGVELVGERMGVVERGSVGEKILTSRAKNAREMGRPAARERTRNVDMKLTRKQRGEMAEAAFVAKAASYGLCVSKPWGESSRYDLIVDNGRRLLRVQVKSAHRAGEYGGYTFHAHGNTARVYEASEIDLLVAYIVPADAWYVFPVEEFRKYKSMKLFPVSRRRRSKFEKFREAWGVVGVESDKFHIGRERRDNFPQ